jgi:hypothetical protein
MQLHSANAQMTARVNMAFSCPQNYDSLQRGALDGEGQSESSLSVSRWQNLFRWTNDMMLEPKSESESSGGIRLGVNCKGTDER